MVTLLSLLLLAQFFTPAQEQTISAGAPPLEVLEVEVLAYEFKPRRVRDPRNPPPPGPVDARDIRGVRGDTATREQPTIGDRSRELREIGRRTDRQPVMTRSSGGYSYEYRIRVKNTSPKKIKSILWEYQLPEGSDSTIVGQRLFFCPVTVKPGSIKLLAPRTPSPPSRVVSAETSDDKSQTHKAIINRVEYSDGSTWIREGWKQEDATMKARDLRDGHCILL